MAEEEATSRLVENRVFSDHTKHARRETLELGYRGRRQTVFCSATIPQRKHFVQTCVKNGWTQSEAELVLATPEQLTPVQVVHEEVVWSAADTGSSDSSGDSSGGGEESELGQEREDEVKVALLKYILKAEMAAREKEGAASGVGGDDAVLFQTMVFTESPAHAEDLRARLQAALPRLYKDAANGSGMSDSEAGKDDLVRVLSDDMDIDSRGEALEMFRFVQLLFFLFFYSHIYVYTHTFIHTGGVHAACW